MDATGKKADKKICLVQTPRHTRNFFHKKPSSVSLACKTQSNSPLNIANTVYLRCPTNPKNSIEGHYLMLSRICAKQ